MPCYRPLKAFRTSAGVSFSQLRRDDHIGSIELPCGQCIGCRMRRASDWELRVMHEASLWERNCFVTLTYGRDQVPPNGSLNHRDFQLFMKRLRVARSDTVRFYMCGEYGPLNQRPHYHACLFNVDFPDQVPAGRSKSGQVMYTSPELERLWKFGRVTVQPLVRETAGYCARYIMKKAMGPNAEAALEVVNDDGEILQRRPEYSAMSLKPGIGAHWFERYRRDVFPHDRVVANGIERPVPTYYDKLAKRTSVDTDLVQFQREQKAIWRAADNTDERLAVREKVFKARIRTLTRGDSDELQ